MVPDLDDLDASALEAADAPGPTALVPLIEEASRHGWDGLPDATLTELVAGAVSAPRTADPTSFVLHAPLEVLARSELLRRCSPDRRAGARARLLWTAARFVRADHAAPSPPDPLPDDLDELSEVLVRAIAEGDLDLAGGAGAALGARADVGDLVRRLAPIVVPSLAAAAHGSIFLHLLPRIAPFAPAAGAMLGPLARELARNPDRRLTWFDAADGGPGAADADRAGLGDAVARTPVLGSPGSTFIDPLMHQTETSGLAVDLLGPHVAAAAHDPGRALRDVLRVATASMLVDDADHAPYGWTHCLTLPLAVTSIAPQLRDPRAAVAVAATQVVGFRAALGRAPLADLVTMAAEEDRTATGTDSAGGDAADLLDHGPRAAGTTTREADPARRAAVVQAVVDDAVVHRDAHLAKYLVGCLDLARRDPDAAPQHLAAAASLAAWWRQADAAASAS